MAEVKKFYDVQGSAIKWRNFEGKAGKFNAEGDRNFCLLIDPDSADVLQSEGFNIRYLKPREDGDVPVPYLPVKVAYGKGRPPKIVMVTKEERQILMKIPLSFLTGLRSRRQILLLILMSMTFRADMVLKHI